MPFIPTPPPRDILDRMSPEMRAKIAGEYREHLIHAERNCGGNARFGAVLLALAIAAVVIGALAVVNP